MALPQTLADYLAGVGISYRVVEHPETPRIQHAAELAELPPGQVARGVLVTGPDGPWLIVVPTDRLLDFVRVEGLLGRPVELVSALRAQRCFHDCGTNMTPAVGAAYALATAIDQRLDDLDEVHLAVGCADRLISISAEGFQRLFSGCPRGDFSRPVTELAPPPEAQRDNPYSPPDPDGQCLARLYALPPMPTTAARILQLSTSASATVDELASLVESDPALAAQVMRYARSAFIGYRGELESVRDAIHRVLGFETVVHLAVALAAARPLQTIETGPLGRRAFWQHATLSAMLAQQLARRLPPSLGVKPGLAYLAALLHDVGFLLMGYLCKPEFATLNRMVASQPDVPVVALEQQLLAMGEGRQVVSLGHARMGAWLMHAWSMPEEVVTAIAEHHRTDYKGPHAAYAELVLVVDRLLRRFYLGAGDSREIPPEVLQRLGLRAEVVEQAFERTAAQREDLAALAAAMAG